MSNTALILSLGKNQRNQDLLADLLKDAGYDVRTETAPESFEKSLEQTTNPGVVIIDIDGYSELIWDICKVCNRRSIPTLLVASADVGRVQTAASEYGVEHVFSKPLDTDQLTGVLDTIL